MGAAGSPWSTRFAAPSFMRRPRHDGQNPRPREGIETPSIDGVTVRVTTPARTVADCFKCRHKIGLDVALEALRRVPAGTSIY